MGTVGTHSINGALYDKMSYDMVKNFSPERWQVCATSIRHFQPKNPGTS
jgi:hypothetical protein